MAAPPCTRHPRLVVCDISGGGDDPAQPGPFPAGDGQTVMLGLQHERERVVFCEQVLRQPALLPPGSGDTAWPPRMDPIPALGQHTDAILAELGWSPAEITAMREAGA